ncbi:hypothetical protein ACIBCN_25555 [Nocardia sp. NPDC051052]|uniref:hypothetical protein n=1 Tax=Nocardia sp. NPDC051052 TaxID=3364322 RepID=UPI00379B7E33
MLSTKHFRRATLPFAAASVILAGVLWACASTGTAKPAPGAAPAPVASAAAVAPAGAPGSEAPAKTQDWLKISRGTALTGANAVQLAIADNNAVGQYVTAADRALYRFGNDTADPSKSNCAGDCAVTWPPLVARRGQAVYAGGIDPQLVGFVERADGACQITIAGWPVYYFAKDRKAGDLLGQGIGGIWHAVTPTGGKAGVN